MKLSDLRPLRFAPLFGYPFRRLGCVVFRNFQRRDRRRLGQITEKYFAFAVNLADSNHWEIANFSSSIAAHPASPKLAHTAISTSATRPQARIDSLSIRGVAGSLVVLWGGREGGTLWLLRG